MSQPQDHSPQDKNGESKPLRPEQARIERILRQHSDRIHRHLCQSIPSAVAKRVLADDVLQEVWMAAFMAASALASRTDDDIVKWLYRVAQRRMVDALRFHLNQKRGMQHEARQMNPSSSLSNLYDRLMARDPSPTKVAQRNDVTQLMKNAINMLPELNRRAINLHLDGKNRAEIAEALDKSPDAVRGILYRGMVQLGEILRDGNSSTVFICE